MVKKYAQLDQLDLALEKAEMLFAGRVEFLSFLSNPQDRHSILFENNDSIEYQLRTKNKLNRYVKEAVEFLKTLPEYESDTRIKELFNKYDLE